MSHYLPQCVLEFFDQPPEIKFQATRTRIKKLPKHDPIAPLIPFLPDLQPPPKSQHDIKAEENALRDELCAAELAKQRTEYDRNDPPLEADAELTTDPKLTLFIGRLDYNIDADILSLEFGRFGTIVHCHIVRDPLSSEDNNHRGYAFVQFDTKEACEKAYHEADGQKIGSRHIVVEYERRRTDPSWYPRRLGGGIGFSRSGNPEDSKFSAPGRAAKAVAIYNNQQQARREALERAREQERIASYSRGGRGNNFPGNFRGGGGRGGRGGRGGGGGDGGFRHQRHDANSNAPRDYLDVGDSQSHRKNDHHRDRDNRDHYTSTRGSQFGSSGGGGFHRDSYR